MSLRRNGCVRASGGFWLVTAWFGLVNGWRLLCIILGASAIHELGHYLALRCLGASCRRLRLEVLGAVLETDGRRLSYGRELACVLAGPGANLTWLMAGGVMRNFFLRYGRQVDHLSAIALVLCAIYLLCF